MRPDSASAISGASVLDCLKCHGSMRVIALLTQSAPSHKILKHTGQGEPFVCYDGHAGVYAASDAPMPDGAEGMDES